MLRKLPAVLFLTFLGLAGMSARADNDPAESTWVFDEPKK